MTPSLCLRMKRVVRCFIFPPQGGEGKAGESYGQADEAQQRLQFVLRQLAQGHGQVVQQHGCLM